jgi:multidrug transporter EmrE-like cation transporter
MTQNDYRGFGLLAALFVAVGVVYALLRGDGMIFGALAGALLFGFMIGVGFLATWIGGKR